MLHHFSSDALFSTHLPSEILFFLFAVEVYGFFRTMFLRLSRAFVLLGLPARSLEYRNVPPVILCPSR
jgi:hypothetical protein